MHEWTFVSVPCPSSTRTTPRQSSHDGKSIARQHGAYNESYDASPQGAEPSPSPVLPVAAPRGQPLPDDVKLGASYCGEGNNMAVPIERIRRVAKQGQLELRCVREEMARPTATSTSHLPGYSCTPLNHHCRLRSLLGAGGFGAVLLVSKSIAGEHRNLAAKVRLHPTIAAAAPPPPPPPPPP